MTRAPPSQAAHRAPGTAQEIALRIELRANELGFDAFGITTPQAMRDRPIDAAAELGRFIELGRHGDMDWMAREQVRRSDALALWPQARSIIMLGISYAPSRDPLMALQDKARAAISVYACGKDYHDIVKSRLKQLAQSVAGQTGADVKVFVDTAPLMEKPLAAAAGLGWQGKHTNLVSRTHGSWLFLGAILTTAELAPNAGESDHCGSCRRCLDICPTGAFPAPYELDARRCIAYLTIEHKGTIPRSFRAAIGNRVFGCDDCLAVCPWNKFARTAREARFAARLETDNPPLAELLELDDAAFRARFAGTPIKRTGRDRFVRNVVIAAANSGDTGYLPAIRKRLDDTSPLVRAMAVYALHCLASREGVNAEAQQRYAGEVDANVRAEWATALGFGEGAPAADE